MVATYCSLAQVSSFMGVPTFASGTDPSNAEVVEFIENNQDLIDIETQHAWRSVTVIEELHTIEYTSDNYRDGAQIFLGHRIITALSTGSGDKLEVWNGTIDEDYLVTRTEGRNNDWWIDLPTGLLFIKTFPVPFYSRRRYTVKVTYRYGETSVAADIRKACTLLTAVDVLSSDDRSVLLPEGTQNIGLLDKFEKWQDQANRIIEKRKEWPIAII